jgi:molybdenum cofactor guanylyltransferase
MNFPPIDHGFLPPVCVLAGGKSSRFPGDKALVEIDGLPQLQRLTDELRRQDYFVHIVADSRQRYASLGIDCLVDSYPSCGPLGGLITGLQSRLDELGAGWLLVMGCDQYLWRTEWLAGMQRLLSSDRSWYHHTDPWAEFHIALWTGFPTDILQPPNPIPGLYHTDLLPCLHQQCQNNKLSLQSVLQILSVKVYYHQQKEQPRNYSFNSPDQLSGLVGLHRPSRTAH